MKPIMLFTAAILIFCSTCFSQEKMKTKTRDSKVKVKDDGSITNTKNNNLQADSVQAAELVQLSKTWMDAMKSLNKPVLEDLMAPEYSLRGPDGVIAVHRDVWLNTLFNNLKIDRFDQSGISAQVYGDVGVVTSLYNWAGSMRYNPFESKGYITDIWVRRINHWQVVSRTSGILEGNKINSK